MTKILVAGDLHIRKHLPYGDLFPDGRRGEWEAVKDTIVKSAEDCGMVVFLGDVLNSKHNHSDVNTELVALLNRFGKKEVHLITGNHEMYPGGTALDFLKEMKRENWNVYTEPQLLNHPSGLNFFFAPYRTKSDEDLNGFLRFLEEENTIIDVFFSHNAFPSPKNKILEETEYLLDLELVPKSKRTFFAHIHNEEVCELLGIQGTGSILTHQVGETKRAIWKYDTEEMTTERIPLPVRGIYKRIWPNVDDVPFNSILKIIVNDKKYDINMVKEATKGRWDAVTYVEDYPDERTKYHIEEGGLDLSIESLLKTYADVKGIDYGELLAGYELIK